MTAKERVRAALEMHVIIAFAGPIAERMATQCTELGRTRILSHAQVVAHHEAGHAVASVALGWGAYELSIVPEPDVKVGDRGHFLGGYASVGPSYHTPDRVAWRRSGLWSDRQTAARFSVALSWPDEGWRVTLRTARHLRARASVLVAEYWHLVRYLARELEQHERMCQPEIEKIILEAHAAEVIRRRVFQNSKIGESL